MIFFVFETKADADAANAIIAENVREFVATNSPDALSPDGSKLRGRRADTGELVDVYTERWAEPLRRADSRWVFAKPTQEKTAPLPVSVFLAGVVAGEEEYDPAWFPPVPMA
jgi:hypothetical protein